MRKAKPQGFTLIELMIAMSVSLLVMAGATEAMNQMEIFRRNALRKTALNRDAMMALDWVRRDLYAVGVGTTKNGRRWNGAALVATTAYSQLRPPIMELTAGTRGDPSTATLTSPVTGLWSGCVRAAVGCRRPRPLA